MQVPGRARWRETAAAAAARGIPGPVLLGRHPGCHMSLQYAIQLRRAIMARSSLCSAGYILPYCMWCPEHTSKAIISALHIPGAVLYAALQGMRGRVQLHRCQASQPRGCLQQGSPAQSVHGTCMVMWPPVPMRRCLCCCARRAGHSHLISCIWLASGKTLAGAASWVMLVWYFLQRPGQ